MSSRVSEVMDRLDLAVRGDLPGVHESREFTWDARKSAQGNQARTKLAKSLHARVHERRPGEESSHKPVVWASTPFSVASWEVLDGKRARQNRVGWRSGSKRQGGHLFEGIVHRKRPLGLIIISLAAMLCGALEIGRLWRGAAWSTAFRFWVCSFLSQGLGSSVYGNGLEF